MHSLAFTICVVLAAIPGEASSTTDDTGMVQVDLKLEDDDSWPSFPGKSKPAKKTVSKDSVDNSKEFTCAPLKNHGGTFFSVNISVGTPPQYFSVVADTGSNALIVPSCECHANQMCNEDDACFEGDDGKSSTFVLDKGPYGPYRLALSFGSGDIETVLMKEVVSVGDVNLTMKRGVLAMTKNYLRISTAFEGILGLGPPEAGTDDMAVSRPEQQQATLEDMMNGMADGEGGEVTIEAATQAVKAALHAKKEERVANKKAGTWDWMKKRFMPNKFGGHHSLAPAKNKIPFVVPKQVVAPEEPTNPNVDASGPDSIPGPVGFLEEAGISRFSVCFSAAEPGVLRLGMPEAKNPIASMGKEHWGVDFRGISVGEKADESKVVFCTKDEMNSGQKSPCGAIPDSGTTLLLGPEGQVDKLYEQICDGWKRCKDNYTALSNSVKAAQNDLEKGFGFDPFHLEHASKKEVFSFLLQDCNSWLGDGSSAHGTEGLNELPTLNFHIRGSKGQKETWSLSGWSYVLETWEDGATEKSGRKVCEPAISSVEYMTESNGPVWIVGTPLFYEYVVGYDMGSNSMSFVSTKETPCTPCGSEPHAEDASSLMKHKTSLQKSEAAARARPRHVTGKFRYPSYDLGKGHM